MRPLLLPSVLVLDHLVLDPVHQAPFAEVFPSLEDTKLGWAVLTLATQCRKNCCVTSGCSPVVNCLAK
eukprot:8140430-Prorocentrum_lima.AAC.1